ncbi:hypothetical protein ABZ671_27360 [Micromonospora sp. NPDC006766]|uniref:hypothetical protein n=1 Tax=Micromonospora sp. NPDC006766 TaxID=3154778 RepID=UPI0033F10E29
MTVTVHAILAFGQPVFAGVYLTGSIRGLELHARGADVVFTLGVVQFVIAVAISVRSRRVWHVVASALVTAAEALQYLVGMSGRLWVHFPFGVAIISGLALYAVAAWAQALPARPVRTDPRRTRVRAETVDA